MCLTSWVMSPHCQIRRLQSHQSHCRFPAPPCLFLRKQMTSSERADTFCDLGTVPQTPRTPAVLRSKAPVAKWDLVRGALSTSLTGANKTSL